MLCTFALVKVGGANLTTNKLMMQWPTFQSMLLKTGNRVKHRGNSLANVESVVFTKLVVTSQLAVCFQSGHSIKLKTYSKPFVPTPELLPVK